MWRYSRERILLDAVEVAGGQHERAQRTRVQRRRTQRSEPRSRHRHVPYDRIYQTQYASLMKFSASGTQVYKNGGLTDVRESVEGHEIAGEVVTTAVAERRAGGGL